MSFEVELCYDASRSVDSLAHRARCLRRCRASGFVRSDRTDTEGLGAITEENQGFSSNAGELVIFLRRQEDDIVFLEDLFVPLKSFHRTLAANDEKSLRRLVKVHRRAVARFEVKHP